ncbi:MAG TPA: T9SS C-terminal target domain-containing protein [Bacteroidia bacterium]|nr:T9SS C-terminal target domain-containing protein [Bacteroidia bacterium]
MKGFAIILWSVVFTCGLRAQVYPPAAGHPGSTAMYKDSSVFVNWASACSVQRGYQDISNPTLGFASAGDSSMALGKALSNGVLSLGDGGSALLRFPFLISNGPGFDLAVFENGFDDFFLELAFVEVSSDGIHFFRFPSHSLSDTLQQKSAFDSTNASDLNNLAGKYRAGYGTPFDLQELSGIPELDINAISYVKIVDVVGSLLPQYARRDFYQNKINDPWPTPFASSGFDLDAVGVIHENRFLSLKQESYPEERVIVIPNPVSARDKFRIQASLELISISCYNAEGLLLWYREVPEMELPALEQSGVYFLKIRSAESVFWKKILVD